MTVDRTTPVGLVGLHMWGGGMSNVTVTLCLSSDGDEAEGRNVDGISRCHLGGTGSSVDVAHHPPATCCHLPLHTPLPRAPPYLPTPPACPPPPTPLHATTHLCLCP